jgi:hypothetical protein
MGVGQKSPEYCGFTQEFRSNNVSKGAATVESVHTVPEAADYPADATLQTLVV